MDPVAELFLMCAAMFIGCYAAGKLPLIFQNRESKGQLMSVFGAGMLVGTAFTVIIPEGIRALYQNCNDSVDASSTHQAAETGAHAHDHETNSDNEFIIAVSLLFGFLFMLLVDKCASSHHAAGRTDIESVSNGSSTSTGSSSNGGRKVCTATLGLVVHAAADGIALGAAAASHHADVELIVFLAIMLHKAPTAFGLTAFLVREGSDYRKVNRLLFVFSAAAPVAALAIYTLINLSGSASVPDSSNTSAAMLFSAGTFLYVATVHIIPELMSSSGPSAAGAGDQATGGAGQLSWKQLCTMILGAFVPLLFSLGHHH